MRWPTPLLVLLIGVAPITLFAQADQYEQKGYNPEKAFHIGDIDSINFFSGNLSISNIPIGQRYPVGGGLSYGINLVYIGPQFETWYRRDVDCTICGSPECKLAIVREPDRLFNAGNGWIVNPGVLYPPYTGQGTTPGSTPNCSNEELIEGMSHYHKQRWSYVGPDGERTWFHGSLHDGEDGGGALYSRNNSYLRFKHVSSSLKTVEFPSGEIHEFEKFEVYDGREDPFNGFQGNGFWRVTKISDRFGNWVTFDYSDPAKWRIDDSTGRYHEINFAFHDNMKERTFTLGYLVDTIDMAGPGGTRSIYQLNYIETPDLREGCRDPDQDPVPRGTRRFEIDLLTNIDMPEGLTYEMATAGVPDYNLQCGGSEPGALTALRLPTRGRIEWGYSTRFMPVNNEDTRQNQFPDPNKVETHGVSKRTMLTEAGAVIGEWEYSHEYWPPDPDPDFQIDVRETRVHVKDAAGDCVTHYFDADPGWSNSGPGAGWAYGLPFSFENEDAGGRHLSTEVTDSTSPVGNDFECSGNVLRRTYVKYDRDELPGDPLPPIDLWWQASWHDTNRRLIEERTVFVDDGNRFAGTVYSDFDGLGHYRTATTNGNFASGNVRTTSTNYNPANGTYPGSFVPPGAGAPWVLTTYDETSVSEGGTTYRQEFCFNPATGFLDRKRILAESGQQANDVIVHYNMDPRFEVPGGMIQFERYYGGDVQGVSNGNLCSIFVPSEEQYEIEHQPENGFGTVRWIRYNDEAGEWMRVAPVHRNIDPNTALPSETIDDSLLVTTWTYDALGRPVLRKPQGQPFTSPSRTEYVYTPASGSTPARVDVFEKTNDGGATLTERRLHFDGHGRLMREERELPIAAGGGFNRRDTDYTPRGFIDQVSTTWSGTPSRWTRYNDYDQFGRPGSITAPDGSVVTFDYDGVRRVKRTVSVDGANATTTEEYDRQGRLIKVTEANGTVTSYQYDPANRLTSVSMTAGNATQARSFEYDGRGFLLSESHPEKATAVDYQEYDALGHAGRVIDGTSDLSFTYDRAERVTLIEDTSSGRDRKKFEYAFSNGTNNWKQGKLEYAWRYHDHSAFAGIPDVIIEEEYMYRGPAGLPTRRTVRRNGQEVYRLGTAYTALGLPSHICYPFQCGHAEATERTYQYIDGLLTQIDGYASFGYYPNLMPLDIFHTNGVKDSWGADPDQMRRPGRIRTTAEPSGTVLFDTGVYTFDGAGNITAMGADSFKYDSLSRLTFGSAEGGQFTEQNVYDPFANRVAATTNSSGTPLARQNPTDPQTNRLLGTASRPIAYDLRGNLTTWGTASYTYDPLDTMMRLQDGNLDEVYLYTADDERVAVIQTAGGSQDSARWMIRDFNDQVVSVGNQMSFNDLSFDWVKDYIRRGTTIVAKETPTGTRHASVDHLGTPRLWHHSDQSIQARHDYLPFGEEVTFNQHGEEVQFTGHERDAHQSGGCSGTEVVDGELLNAGEQIVGCDAVTSQDTTVAGTQTVRFTGGREVRLGEGFNVNGGSSFAVAIDGYLIQDRQDLDYMHARYASPFLGRFTSVDPKERRSALKLSQMWNRYTYAVDNPLKWVDPNGEDLMLSWDFSNSSLSTRQQTRLIRRVHANFRRSGVSVVMSASGSNRSSLKPRLPKDTLVPIVMNSSDRSGFFGEHTGGVATVYERAVPANASPAEQLNFLVNTVVHEAAHGTGALPHLDQDAAGAGSLLHSDPAPPGSVMEVNISAEEFAAEERDFSQEEARLLREKLNRDEEEEKFR